MTKVIIAGGRDFNDYDLLKKTCDNLLSRLVSDGEDIEIVSGTASGADTLGEKYAKEKGYKIKRFPADWSLGAKAGPIRNSQMADYATHCICFWDNKSRGTKSMINLAKKKNLKLRVVSY